MISSLITTKYNVFKTVFGFNSETAGELPTLGAAFCEEGGFLLRLRQKSQGLGIRYFSKGSIQPIETIRHSYNFCFFIIDDGSLKYKFSGRHRLLWWVPKSTYFIMMCLKLHNISRQLKLQGSR